MLEIAARKGVHLEIVEFQSSTHSAEEAARALGVNVGQIVKSLVFVAPRDGGELEPYVVLIAGSDRVDIGLLAAVTGEPGIRKATAAEAKACTGYSIGGIPPFGHTNPVHVIMDPALGRHETVWAAGGLDNAVFATTPAALRSLANAVAAPVADQFPPSPPSPAGLTSADATTGA
jgi:Cys-tRNA(Pro) deacylase